MNSSLIRKLNYFGSETFVRCVAAIGNEPFLPLFSQKLLIKRPVL